MSCEKPFTISIPDAQLALLHQKLALATFPDELSDAGWDHGVPLSDIRRLAARWSDSAQFDWRVQEAKLNAELPQFTRDIDVEGHGTLNIHYIHKRSAVEGAIPLLFLHGWPGCFLESRKVAALATQGSAEFPAFNLVALSHPGFGFSEGPKTKGFAVEKYAEVAHKLMLPLGYDEYVIQGGDFGHLVSYNIAKIYGVKHCIGAPPAGDANPLTPAEGARLAKNGEFFATGMGYVHIQSTRPQTLGYSLADSPVGLLAWIYEKLAQWSDGYPWTDDEVLTWISIYWFSRAGPTASIRSYREGMKGNINSLFEAMVKEPIQSIPMGISHFPNDSIVMPKSWTRCLGNIVFDGVHESGGHFAAYERSEELVGDLRKMFGKSGPAFGVVSGKSGYA
ncbi:Alpha/Beta hydrolase protein [Roridomyces roridus]|uniref:Alpha/Beta hydrolase protein n=1 Tax=Roridomyces roridus TaxID=1738132 RepID=A0AAD7FTP2_9AGAR|nr:Alpha/Beta hydrolase protein [Roridomyces roridus]